MIDSVSSLVSDITTMRNMGTNSDDSSGPGSDFMRLLDALAGGPSGGQPSLTEAAAGAITNMPLVADDLLAGINCTGREGNAEMGVEVTPAASGKKEDNSSAAIEMVLALINAAVARLQPFQVDALDKGALGKADLTLGDDSRCEDVGLNDLANELLGLPPGERLAFLQQAINGQKGLASGDLKLQDQSTIQDEASEMPLQLDVAGAKPKTPDSAKARRAADAMVKLDDILSKAKATVLDGTKTKQDDGTKQSLGDANSPNAANIQIAGQINLSSEKRGQKEDGSTDHPSMLDRVLEVGGTLHDAGDPSAVGQQSGNEVKNANALNTSIVEQIAKRAQLLVTRGKSGLSIQLEPQELGKVRVYVSVGNDGLQVRMATETSDTRQIIQASLPQLRSAFESQGLRVESFDVRANSGFSSFNLQQDHSQRQGLMQSQSQEHYLWNQDVDVDSVERVESRRNDSLVDYRI